VATLRDVAELAGVSVGTASQALNHRPGVAPETRLRVLQAASELGYLIKQPALSQASPISIVGLLVKHDIETPLIVNPFYSHVQAGVESECRRFGMALMYSNVEVDDKNRPIEWPALLSEQRIDGLIVAGTFIEDTLDKIKRRTELPIILLDGYAPDCLYDSVVTDNFQGAFNATQYLIEQGHTCIGLIGSTEDSTPSIRERREGYIKALMAAGIHDTYIEESRLIREAGYEAVLRLLQRAPQITAIFVCNDETAMGVLKAARDMGRNVPGNLSVMGFDDLLMSGEISPALTTVHVYKEWMGKIGVHRLLERVQNPEMPQTTTVLPTRIIVRESVRSLAEPVPQ